MLSNGHTVGRMAAAFGCALWVVSLSGCARLGLGEPLVNAALEPGVESKARKDGDAALKPVWDAPACVDGDRKTPTYATEIDVVLPQPRPLRMVVVRAPDVINAELYVRQSARAGWKLRRAYHDRNGGTIKEDLSDLDAVDGVKIVVRKSTRDSTIGVEEAMRTLGDAAHRTVRELIQGTTYQWEEVGGLSIKPQMTVTDNPVLPIVRRSYAPIYEIELLGPALVASADHRPRR